MNSVAISVVLKFIIPNQVRSFISRDGAGGGLYQPVSTTPPVPDLTSSTSSPSSDIKHDSQSTQVLFTNAVL